MRRRSPVVTAVLAVIALVLLPAISNVEANVLPASWAPFLWIAWPAGGLLAAPLVYLEIRHYHDQRHASEQDAASADERLRLLATASMNQWKAAANDRRLVHPDPLPMRWRRATAPVAGPVSTTEYVRFDPLPGLDAVNIGELSEGTQDTLHQLYGGLTSGRLLLIGEAGSGKSAAAILLLLKALHFREDATREHEARIPVPVLFTLHGWNPGHGDSVVEWMAGKLVETYPMFRGRAGRRVATALLTAGRVAAFLDGLDEIPKSVRPGVLAALADAPFRLVVLSRTKEAVDTAQDRPLAGAVAVELQPVHPADAAAYLRQSLVDPPPEPWQKISAHLAAVASVPGLASAFAEAVATPLALSLLRDVYGATDPVHDLLDESRFRTAADITNHLLDDAIKVAYTPRPGHPAPRYTVATAEHTLRYVATRLSRQHTRDLAWWHIPLWTTRRSRMIALAIVNVLSSGVVLGLGLGLPIGLQLGLSAGLVFGISATIGIGFVTVLASTTVARRGLLCTPKQISRVAYRSTSHSPVTGLIFALPGGMLAGISDGLVSGPSDGLVSGILVGLVSGLVGLGLVRLARNVEVDARSLGPADVWCHDRTAGVVYLLVSGTVIGLLAALTVRLVPGLASKLASGLASSPLIVFPVMLLVGLVAGLGGMLTATRADTVAEASPGAATLDTAVALLQLAIRHKIPLRLIAFLEDARSRHLVRTVGPVYQFRHATLQDRLSEKESC